MSDFTLPRMSAMSPADSALPGILSLSSSPTTPVSYKLTTTNDEVFTVAESHPQQQPL